MKKDLDTLMEEKDLDVILVVGPAKHNPSMFYFTGNVHVGYADLIKKRGEEPVLFCNPMEREEAAKAGYETRNLAEYKLVELLKEVDNDHAKAIALRYQKMFADLGITKGRIAVYGEMEVGWAYSVFNEVQALMPEIEIVGEMGEKVINKAMETKDKDELAHIRQMGKVTAEVVGMVAEFLQSHKAKDGVLVKEDGKPLTIGEIKNNINLWLAERGAENPHDCIFAIGRDAGIPHSTGNLEDVLELGKTIVFDIFIQEPGGGYHYDFTRTWCLGYAPKEAQELYDDVRAVFDEIMGGLEANTPFHLVQERVCDLFEEQGHKTIRQDPLTQEGYVHSVGHGLGLHIHEEPFTRNKEAILKAGIAVTIEPGLYYPDKGMGCRLEDTIYVYEDGKIEVLADYPYDLVLPVEEM